MPSGSCFVNASPRESWPSQLSTGLRLLIIDDLLLFTICLKSVKAFFELALQSFLDSNLGYYNASVVRMALADILVQQVQGVDEASARQRNLEEALKLYQYSLYDLDRSPTSPKQVSLRVKICTKFEEVVDLCQEQQNLLKLIRQ